MFNKSKTQTPKMEDVMSNTELRRVLDSLTYELGERQGVAIETAQMSELKSKSIFVARLLKGLSGFESTYHLGDYDYQIDTNHISRKSPRLKLPKKKRWINLTSK